MQITPFLTEYDPKVSSDGSIDPLGLYPIADRLATKLIPGFRERMRHPRFLTIMTVGAAICSNFDTDEIAADKTSEPWMVYEWYVVSAMVRTFYRKANNEIEGLPGREKATRALLDGVPISHSRYLKTAKVFGFHGVYRTLAQNVRLMDSLGNLDEFGFELVNAWEKEQGLNGFYNHSSGRGRHFRSIFYEAIKDGLKAGAVARKWGWDFFESIAAYLGHHRGGPKELEVIYERLAGPDSPLRKEVIQFLISQTGYQVLSNTNSEREFHSALKTKASRKLKQLLTAIQSYEEFSRLIQDAFDDCLYRMSLTDKTSSDFLLKSAALNLAFTQLPTLSERVIKDLDPFFESGNFLGTYGELILPISLPEFLHSLITLHFTIQRNKPPSGKRPWFEKTDDHTFMIYSNHKRDREPEPSELYVHFYRSFPLLSFMRDLKKVND